MRDKSERRRGQGFDKEYPKPELPPSRLILEFRDHAHLPPNSRWNSAGTGDRELERWWVHPPPPRMEHTDLGKIRSLDRVVIKVKVILCYLNMTEYASREQDPPRTSHT